jgi:hypothetical protein
MADEPQKPKQRRRRWLIVATVLVLVSLVSWWYWPRGDARFVGKWVGREEWIYLERMDFDFRRNGSGRAEWGQFPFAFEMSFQWSVQGDKLLLSTIDQPFLIEAIATPSEIRLRDPFGRGLTLRKGQE